MPGSLLRTDPVGKQGRLWVPQDIPNLTIWLSPRSEQRVSSATAFTNWARRQPNDLAVAAAQSISLDDRFYARGTANLTAQRDLQANAYSGPSGSHYLAAVLEPNTTGDTLQYVLDSDTGTDRLIFAHLTNSSGQVGWFDGSWHSIAAASTSPQVLEWVLGPQGDTGNGYVYRNGTLLGSAAYTARALGTSVSLFDNQDTPTSGNQYLGYAGDVLYYSGAVSDRDRARLRRYLARKHSILGVL